jgi:6-phosphogluconolactonase
VNTLSRFAYMGTYTAGSGNGRGIYLYEVNPFTGELTLVSLASAVPDPSFVLAAPSGKFLYCTNEISNFQGSTNGSVTAFSVDTADGTLTLLNTVSSLGGGPVYRSLDHTRETVPRVSRHCLPDHLQTYDYLPCVA